MCVERIVDRFGFNNLTKVIMVVMFKGGGLTKEKLSKKLLCQWDECWGGGGQEPMG